MHKNPEISTVNIAPGFHDDPTAASKLTPAQRKMTIIAMVATSLLPRTSTVAETQHTRMADPEIGEEA